VIRSRTGSSETQTIMAGSPNSRTERPSRRGERTPRSKSRATAGRPSDKPPRRREQRVTINKEFESFDAFVAEYVTNISRSGVFVRTRKPLAIGTKVNLRFTVLMDEVETVDGVGEVVRVHDDPPGMGVVFTELSSYSKGIIERLLTAQPPRSTPGRGG
jgi:uncharacterized protein (TIGR02266 family)